MTAKSGNTFERGNPEGAARKLLIERRVHADVFLGTQEELCSAGLAQPNQFPGQPGLPKAKVTYFAADGVPVPNGINARYYEPTKVISRISGKKFRVTIYMSEEEETRRWKLVERGAGLALDIPGPAAAPPSTPDWAPAGWELRAHRISKSDFVFVVTDEQIAASGLLAEAQTACESAKRPSPSWRPNSIFTRRFGPVRVSQRDARSYYVVCYAPSEVRNAGYHLHDYGHSVIHTGTKEQLQSKGLAVGVAFPGEPGRNPRKLTVTDPTTGSRTQIALLPQYRWCGDTRRFELTIKRSEEQQKTHWEKQTKAEAERKHLDHLKGLPDSPDAFRGRVADLLWELANIVKRAMKPAHGYRFTDEVVTEFMDGATDAYWALKNGAVGGRSREAELSETARQDATLQAFLAPFREAH